MQSAFNFLQMRSSSNATAVGSPVRPGPRYGDQPEKTLNDDLKPIDHLVKKCLIRGRSLSLHGRIKLDSKSVLNHIEALEAESSQNRHQQLQRLKSQVCIHGHTRDTLLLSMAHVVNVVVDLLNIKAYPEQIQAALGLLQNNFVEMDTGEGKTLATVLAACVAALDGTPVHVLTSNEYLAERDHNQYLLVYMALGLRSASVNSQMTMQQRRDAYQADVVHLTGNQIGFDWMRDALAAGTERDTLAAQMGRLTKTNRISEKTILRESTTRLHRGLCMGIVDEADSLLIDEARTPLVLATPRYPHADFERQAVIALAVAGMLKENHDYHLATTKHSISLTDQGLKTIDDLSRSNNHLWSSTKFRDEHIRMALIVLNLYFRNRDYVIKNDRVMLVDQHTGRTMPDRRLSSGLHTMLEVKESCSITPEFETAASIASQHIYQRYHRLSGTSGTLKEVKKDLVSCFGAGFLRVKPANINQRVIQKPIVFPDSEVLLSFLVNDVNSCLSSGRPVLIGTRTVEQSRRVSQFLDSHDITHRVLNAEQDSQEAEIVAQAGVAGQVTVATNMAGRGTDIPVNDEVANRGGLHVISCALLDARRLDRQLAGRSARQGQPGSYIQLWSLDDQMLEILLTTRARAIFRRLCNIMINAGGPLKQGPVLAMRILQRLQEKRHRSMRTRTLKQFKHYSQKMALSPQVEQSR